MSENPKQLVELARLSSQQETNDGGMLYSRLADCIERLLDENAALAGQIENVGKADGR
jgi:hypothetical protein